MSTQSHGRSRHLSMTTGFVNEEGDEAVISVRLRSADRAELSVNAIIDTGFTGFLALAPSLIQKLSWSYLVSTQVVLADGTLRNVDVYEGRIRWNDAWRTIRVQASKGGTLLGM